MRSERSSGSFSSALFIENIRRFWLLALAGTVLYFLCAPFSMLSELDGMRVSLVRELLNHHNVGFIFFDVLMPLAAAVAVFSYLNGTGSVNMMHSMPFSRRTLFVSNFLSGLSLAEAPFVLNALLVLALKRPVLSGYYDYEQAVSQYVEVDIYTYPAIGKWALINVLIILFIFAVAVLGMMVSGNTVIGFLTAGAFNFLAAALLLCGYAYASMFLYGFSADGEIMSIAFKTNPVLYFPTNGNGIPALAPILIYLVISLAAAVLGYFAYTRRKLERAGESYVFRFMQHVVCFLLTFFAATIVGLLFNAVFGINGGDGINYAGLFLGGLLGFLIARMIVKATPRVFNLDSLKTFAVYAVAIAIIVAAFALDIFGYAKWQPRVSDIAKAGIWNPCVSKSGNYDLYFNEQENIELVEEFQRAVVAARGEELTDGASMQITYVLKNGKLLRRSYNVDTQLVKTSETLRALYESEEIRGNADLITKLDVDKLSVSVADVFGYNSRYSFACDALTESDIHSLLEALAADTRSRTYEEMMKTEPGIAAVNLELRYSVPLSSPNRGSEYNEVPGFHYCTAVTDTVPYAGNANIKGEVEYIASFSYGVDSTTANTLAWMNAHGMSTDSSVFEGCFVQVFSFNDVYDEKYNDSPKAPAIMETRWDSLLEKPASDSQRIVVSDPEKIAELWFDYSCDYEWNAGEPEKYKSISIYRTVQENGEIRYEPCLFAYVNTDRIPSWLQAEMDRYFE